MSDIDRPDRAPRLLAVEHEEHCPPAHLGTWLTEAGAVLEVCRPYLGDPLPPLGEYAAWLVLGGSMGANDDADHWWLAPVKERIREAAATGVPLLGVCLGHQLAAAALGGTVVRNPLGQQVGLYDVGWEREAHLDPLLAPLATPRRGVQWNDDIVSALPEGAVALAHTDAGELQVARFAPSMWGVQLHPEVDAPMLRQWAEGDREAHAARGIDQEAVLAGIDAARAELDAAWRPLAVRLVELAVTASDRRRSAS